MKLNTKIKSEPIFTHEGGKAVKINDYLLLKRAVNLIIGTNLPLKT